MNLQLMENVRMILKFFVYIKYKYYLKKSYALFQRELAHISSES